MRPLHSTTKKSRLGQLFISRLYGTRIIAVAMQGLLTTRVCASTGAYPFVWHRANSRKNTASQQTRGQCPKSGIALENMKSSKIKDLQSAWLPYSDTFQQNITKASGTEYRRLQPMVGLTIDYLDAVQKRNRGSGLHAMICEHLGYSAYENNGTYPDIANQSQYFSIKWLFATAKARLQYLPSHQDRYQSNNDPR